MSPDLISVASLQDSWSKSPTSGHGMQVPVGWPWEKGFKERPSTRIDESCREKLGNDSNDVEICRVCIEY